MALGVALGEGEAAGKGVGEGEGEGEGVGVSEAEVAGPPLGKPVGLGRCEDEALSVALLLSVDVPDALAQLDALLLVLFVLRLLGLELPVADEVTDRAPASNESSTRINHRGLICTKLEICQLAQPNGRQHQG